MSIDFDVDIPQDIIPFCSEETAELIVEWANNLKGTDNLELPEPPIFGLTVKLGEPQSNAQESYVPLIAQSVSGYDEQRRKGVNRKGTKRCTFSVVHKAPTSTMILD